MIFLFFILASITVWNVSGNLSTEEDIWKALKGQKEHLRYKPGRGEGVNITLGVSIVTIGELEEETGTIEIGYWLKMSWNVSSLMWNPEKFGGLKSIHLPTDEIWVPDIMPYRHKTTEFPISTLVVVNHNGLIHWVPHAISKFYIEPMIGGPRYPKDKMICRFKFGSWTRHGFHLNWTVQSYDSGNLLSQVTTTSLEASGWKLRNASILYESMMYPCCPEPYPAVRVEMELERDYVYYDLTTTAPGTISGLFIATLYLLPPTSPARVISQTLCLLLTTFVGISEMRDLKRTLERAPLVNYFIGLMVLDFIAALWSIIAAILWAQSSYNEQGRSCFDSIVSKIEWICCLPTNNIKDDRRRMNLGTEEDDDEPPPLPILSSTQRLCLALDRLFCLITIVILLFLFTSFRA